MNSPHYILEEFNINFRYVRLYDLDIPREKWLNSGDPDQTLHYAASDLGLHCLPITLLGVSRLQWVKEYIRGFLIVPWKCMLSVLIRIASLRRF